MRAHQGALWWSVRALLPAEGRRRFVGIYSYFRWADDIVDAPDRDRAQVLAFCARQEQVLDAVLAGRPIACVHVAEESLVEAIGERWRDPLLQRAIRLMFAALRFDAHRPASPLGGADLEAQITRVGDAYTAALLVCTGVGEEVPDDLWLLARAATAVHHLRDLALDLGLGYHNLPRGDAARHGVDPAAFSDRELGAYSAERAGPIRAAFQRGRAALRALPTWRARALFWLLAFRYAAKLEQLVVERAALTTPALVPAAIRG